MSKVDRDFKDELFENGMNTFTLTDEDGVDYEFELLDFVDYNENLYAVLVPMENEGIEDDMGIVIMETVFEGNEPVFTFVENERLAQAVLDEYAARKESDDFEED